MFNSVTTFVKPFSVALLVMSLGVAAATPTPSTSPTPTLGQATSAGPIQAQTSAVPEAPNLAATGFILIDGETGETLALPEGDRESAEALLNFARMDGVNRLLGRDIIHFDLRDPDRMYLRKAAKDLPKLKTESDSDSSEKSATSAKEKVSA